MTQPCPQCGFSHHCLCPLYPMLDSSVHIALLTHENELSRDTNTGQILQRCLPYCTTHVWHRKSAPESLQTLLSDRDYAPFIVFPSENSLPIEHVISAVETTDSELGSYARIPVFIVLDGTWQEAKKMVKKSAWLEGLPHVSITASSDSSYQLRRNQDSGNLCTLEVGCELLRAQDNLAQASQLESFFRHYMKVFKADKSGHALK